MDDDLAAVVVHARGVQPRIIGSCPAQADATQRPQVVMVTSGWQLYGSLRPPALLSCLCCWLSSLAESWVVGGELGRRRQWTCEENLSDQGAGTLTGREVVLGLLGEEARRPLGHWRVGPVPQPSNNQVSRGRVTDPQSTAWPFEPADIDRFDRRTRLLSSLLVRLACSYAVQPLRRRRRRRPNSAQRWSPPRSENYERLRHECA